MKLRIYKLKGKRNWKPYYMNYFSGKMPTLFWLNHVIEVDLRDSLMDAFLTKEEQKQIDKNYAYTCECGSVSFNLRRDGEVECQNCQKEVGLMWGESRLNMQKKLEFNRWNRQSA